MGFFFGVFPQVLEVVDWSFSLELLISLVALFAVYHRQKLTARHDRNPHC
jgi:hypothetical protein